MIPKFPYLGTRTIVPNIGNNVANMMHVIGASLLTACALERPEAGPPLRALHALICAADWKSRSCVERQFQAIAHVNDAGNVVLDLHRARTRVILAVNYNVGLVRIVSVATISGSTKDVSTR